MAQAVRRLRPAGGAVILERLGGIAAALTSATLLLGLVGLIIHVRNWLVVLFQGELGPWISAARPLRVLNPLDVALLALVGLTFVGLWPVLGRQHRIWTGIAIALPFIGIPLLLVTGLQGRSSVMGAGLVITVLMFVSGSKGRLLASIGLVANVLLLGGRSRDRSPGRRTGGSRGWCGLHRAARLVCASGRQERWLE